MTLQTRTVILLNNSFSVWFLPIQNWLGGIVWVLKSPLGKKVVKKQTTAPPVYTATDMLFP
jgi:hypothetical protein